MLEKEKKKGKPFLEVFSATLQEDYRFPVLEVFAFLYVLGTFALASFGAISNVSQTSLGAYSAFASGKFNSRSHKFFNVSSSCARSKKCRLRIWKRLRERNYSNLLFISIKEKKHFNRQTPFSTWSKSITFRNRANSCIIHHSTANCIFISKYCSFELSSKPWLFLNRNLHHYSVNLNIKERRGCTHFWSCSIFRPIHSGEFCYINFICQVILI